MVKYNVKEVTSKDMKCGILGGCPGIYEVTPESMKCGIGACPSVYSAGKNYFIIGERHNGKEFGLVRKIGRTEAGILVSQRLIDEMKILR